jgi:hypothetical protein
MGDLRMKSVFVPAITVALLSVAGPARPAEHEAVPSALKKCAAESDSARRLACFDAEMARLAALPPAAPPPTPEEKFGARGDLRRDIEQQGRAGEAPLRKLEATVAAIATRPGGGLVVTLDNGQVWQQLVAGEGFRLKAGEKVTLEPGALGSYFLVGSHGRSTKVKRIK